MSGNTYSAVMATPLGRVGIRCSAGAVNAIDYVGARLPVRTGKEPLVRRTVRALQYYLRDPRYIFDLPLDLPGTVFQCKVWRALRRIPVGETRSYGELARQLGSSPRAVGNACRANPVAVVVPCHRVVAATGIGGYSGATSGAGIQRKRWLLGHEGAC